MLPDNNNKIIDNMIDKYLINKYNSNIIKTLNQ